MKIEFQCRSCGKDITVTSDLFGKNIVCPYCNSTMIAPHPKGNPEAGGCKKTLRFIGLSCIVLVIGFCILGKCGNKESSEPVENIIGRKLQTTFNANRQKIFDNIHPIGTAKGIVVHDVSILAWKSGVRTNRLDDVQQFSVRFTLYWQGPITSDGFTKIEWIWDNETRRNISVQILATNGITNSDLGAAFVELAEAYIYNYLNDN